MKKLYLYLASRSKKGIKLLAVLQSPKTVSGCLTDLSELNLTPVYLKKIQQLINDNRMLYEPMMETASDYGELRAKLRGRGFSEIPLGLCPLIKIDSTNKIPIAETSSCVVKRTMLRKLRD